MNRSDGQREDDDRVTMKVVAREAGVALSSVSRVLNNHPDVSADMRSRVLDVVRELGYERDLLASSLRRGATRTVGFIVSDVSNPLFAEMIKGAESRLRQEDYSIILASSQGEPARDEESARLLRQRRVDGLIVSIADETRRETVQLFASLDIPLVFLDRDIDSIPGSSAVHSDHQAGTTEAVSHLLDAGHTDVAFILGSLNTRPSRERLKGFKAAFQSRKVRLPKEMIRHGPLRADFAERATTDLMGRADPPSAILAGGNLVLTGVLRALNSLEIRPGVDIAVVSSDDVPLAELHRPPISVVSRDPAHMGEVAADLLLDGLQAEDRAGRVVTLPTTFVSRGSTPVLD